MPIDIEIKALPVGSSVGYGPSRPEPNNGYELFTTPKYLNCFSRKILLDLIKAARMYNGREVKLYKVNKTERCPRCTNTITGERLLTACPVCHGTGYKDSWDCLGNYWTYVDFSPKGRIATPSGNIEMPDGHKEQIIILGAPVLKDQALIIFIESKEVYKIYDIEPQFIAMRGDIIAQAAMASRLVVGAEEYKLIDW